MKRSIFRTANAVTRSSIWQKEFTCPVELLNKMIKKLSNSKKFFDTTVCHYLNITEMSCTVT